MLTFGEAWAKETRNLLNKGLRCKESVVFFSEFLDKLLVLVQTTSIVEQIMRYSSRTFSNRLTCTPTLFA